MRFSLKSLIWIVVLLALLGVGIFSVLPHPVDVEVGKVAEQTLKVTVREDGKTRIREKYNVSAPVSGRLSRIELKPGDVCSEQTLLAVILPGDPAILDARARAEATARVRAAEATLQRSESKSKQAKIRNELATTKYERNKQLVAERAISQDEFETIKFEYLASAQAIKTSQFDNEIARFELALAKAAVSRFTNADSEAPAEPFEIRSPVSGKVIRVFQESSRVVSVGTPLLELGDPQNLEIEVDVLSTDAVRMKPGAELTVEHWGGGSPLKGVVRVIEPGAFTKTSSLGVEEQRVNIIADFNEPPTRLQSLGDGYRIEARITIKELDQALTIPNSSLFRHHREWHVLKVVKGRAVLQKVTIGLQNDSVAEVVNGLSKDDQVIVYPSDNLSPGMLVRPVETGSGGS